MAFAGHTAMSEIMAKTMAKTEQIKTTEMMTVLLVKMERTERCA